MARRIFLNYRRKDDPGHAGRLRDRLVHGFSPEDVFMDVDSVPLGANFIEVVQRQLETSEVVLAVIGPRWLEYLKGRDLRQDYVVVEIEQALALGKCVIPVLVGGATMPSPLSLPEAIRHFASYNAALIRPESFASDCERLICHLKDLLARPKGRRRVPPWATAAGTDARGMWADIEASGVRARLRFIDSGRFLMGSPEGEDGRYQDEGPQHEVALTRGFWLGETPCTQALWEAVMGRNPSCFRSPKRPVEQVSWHDVQRFLGKLNAMTPALEARLPAEAEWEYACRAGTTMSTYNGELTNSGHGNNGPVLDAVAWYGGNSGVAFDLNNGVDSSDWPERQYPHTRAGTRVVGGKQPNQWGLYDMLGNVWEWCADRFGDYASEEATDPSGPVAGSHHVARGGSWNNLAGDIRAATRQMFMPEDRYNVLGFRFARSQG